MVGCVLPREVCPLIALTKLGLTRCIRCTAVKLNRPRSVDISIITAKLPSPLATLDPHQAFNNVDHQVANAQLMMILDRIEGPT